MDDPLAVEIAEGGEALPQEVEPDRHGDRAERPDHVSRSIPSMYSMTM